MLQPFNGLFSRTTWVSRYQKGKTNLDFTGARDSERQWHQLGRMQVCTSLQTDNHASTPPLCFLQAGCPSCRPTNSVKALNAQIFLKIIITKISYVNTSALFQENKLISQTLVETISTPCYLTKACVRLRCRNARHGLRKLAWSATVRYVIQIKYDFNNG